MITSNHRIICGKVRHRAVLLLMVSFFFFAFKEEQRDITIFMIGDSTMANKNLVGGNPERGWGQMLPGFFTENIRVCNYAKNGRSSKSFIDEGLWDEVISQVRKGEYVFIQFGHNDEKPDELRHTVPGSTFDDNLRRFVKETKEKGGIPVLFNSIVRRNFRNNTNAILEDDAPKVVSAISEHPKEGDILIDTHGEYLNSPRNVAKDLDVVFIDLNRITHDLVEGLGPEKSKELYMWIPQNTVPICPKGKEDNTHLNIYGARVVAKLAVTAISEAIPELEKYVCYYDFVVAKDGSGDFFTIQEAVNAVPDFRKERRTTILLRKGVYKEKLIIPESKINLSLIGQEGAVISGDDYAAKKNRFGENMSTSGSASCYIYAPDFYAENITFENTAGQVGQAVACFVSGDRTTFKRCRFLGNQDTLYTYGRYSRQYYEDCYIEGTVDFIFGWSMAVFNRCIVHSKRNGYVTAPATDRGKAYGYVFFDCNLTADDDVDKVYLSRPWRPYAQAVFIHCNLGKHILAEGWNNWNKKEAEKTVFYAEYENVGEGANPKARASFSRQLENIKDYTVEKILSGDDGWNPTTEIK